MEWLLADGGANAPVWPRSTSPPPVLPLGAGASSTGTAAAISSSAPDVLIADLLSSLDAGATTASVTPCTLTGATTLDLAPISVAELALPRASGAIRVAELALPRVSGGIRKGGGAAASAKAARDSRALRRREFHKIHTRRSRAKLNDKMDKLLATLPEPPPGVVIKSKAQILDYAISVFKASFPSNACSACSAAHALVVGSLFKSK